jgi:hypothetical protein
MEYEYSVSLIALLKGVVYNHQRDVWEKLIRYEPDIKKYFQPVGLELFLDKSEGFAYLKHKDREEDESPLPRLAEKRQLNFLTSLICIVLRKYLLEHDAQGDSVRSIITEQEIISRTKIFLSVLNDEAKQQEKIISTINRITEIGFLRKLEDQERNYEIHRIIKGFVTADVIDETLKRLQEYAAEKNIEE